MVSTPMRYFELTGLHPHEAAGIRHLSRPRRSPRTVVAVYDAVKAGIDEWGFATVCELHGSCVIHDTLALAKSHAVYPDGWCDGCRADRV